MTILWIKIIFHLKEKEEKNNLRCTNDTMLVNQIILCIILYASGKYHFLYVLNSHHNTWEDSFPDIYRDIYWLYEVNNLRYLTENVLPYHSTKLDLGMEIGRFIAGCLEQ